MERIDWTRTKIIVNIVNYQHWLYPIILLRRDKNPFSANGLHMNKYPTLNYNHNNQELNQTNTQLLRREKKIVENNEIDIIIKIKMPNKRKQESAYIITLKAHWWWAMHASCLFYWPVHSSSAIEINIIFYVVFFMVNLTFLRQFLNNKWYPVCIDFNSLRFFFLLLNFMLCNWRKMRMNCDQLSEWSS